MPIPPKLVLAYSGGLDTSIMLHWLVAQGHDVVAYCADVGQGPELDTVLRRARAAGASDVVIDDLTIQFAEQAILPAIQAQARYEQQYLLGTALARPIVAAGQIACAKRVGARAVAHGATGKGNDQIRFELAYRALAPGMEVIAPWRSWPFEGRGDLLAYAAEHDLDVPVTAEKPYSSDRNLMHISHEGGVLEDPWEAPPADMYQLTADPADAPTARDITIAFEAGIPVAVDGAAFELVQIVEHMNELVGAYGIGRLDIVENRVIGLKSRGVYETPGVSVLMQAWRGLQTLALDRPTLAWFDSLGVRLADQVYDGVWFAPECALVRSAVAEAAAGISGEARIRLEAGRATLLGRRSTNLEYDMRLASFDEAGGFDQSHATGYIKLAGLRLGAGA